MSKVEIIAEIANAHQGDPAHAAELARASAKAGVDAIKFQIYYAHEMLAENHPRFEHFRKQSFDAGVWQQLLAEVRDLGPAIYCDVFGLNALETALGCDVDGYKIHASDLQNTHLTQELANAPGRVIIGAGGGTVREISSCVQRLVASGKRPVLLHGFQAYPTRLEDSCLNRIGELERLFGKDCDIGYADHVAGDDPRAVTVPIYAMGLGAKVIEKHVTFNRAAKGVDYYSSLEPGEMGDFVAHIRACETTLSKQPQAMPDAEMEYRQSVKKHWVAAGALPEGHELGAADLVMKRIPEAGVDPLPIGHLAGHKLKAAVAPDQPITRSMVKSTVWALPVARAKSARLPGKALVDIAGRPAIGHMFERLKQCSAIDRVVFCTTEDVSDDPLAELAESSGIAVHRGEDDDVLARLIGALGDASVDIVLRVTGDDLLIDPDYVEKGVSHHLETHAEYTDLKGLPSGTEVEVFDAALLKELYRNAVDSGGTEFLTDYVRDNASQIRTSSLPVPERHAQDWRLTLDTEEDLALLQKLLSHMAEIGKPLDYRLDDIADFFEANPEALKINARIRQMSKPIAYTTDMNWTAPAD